MPTFKKCNPANSTGEAINMAKALIAVVPMHADLGAVKIDYVFAYADRDDDNTPLNNALNKGGMRAFGLCKVVNLKDRSKGNGDVEILLDHDYWDEIPEEQQCAILDHEMTHIQVVKRNSAVVTDDLNRPKIKLRKHDVEVGWFACVAERNGSNSIEQIQAKGILDVQGQYFWPQLVKDGVQVVTQRQIEGKKSRG